ncbi:MAG: hypothetical protein FK732_10645 [Asgard group archaeon]|nr:hypothetical protein [Asgard group archaeon]
MSETIGTRVEESKVRKMRNLLNITRVFAVLVFISGFALVISSIDSSVWNFQSFWFSLRFFVFIFEIIFLLIGYGIAYMLGYDDSGAVAMMESFHSAIFGGSDTILGVDIEQIILQPLEFFAQPGLFEPLYSFFIMITLFIALVAGLGFLRECNPALSAISFFGMNIVLGLASLSGKLLIDLDFSSGNITQMIFSKLVITAFLIYFSLELSFQASYVYNVIGPNLHRHRRISSNIKRLRDFKMPLEKPRKETRETEDDQSTVVRGKNTSRARMTVTTAFSRIKGLVGQKLFRISVDEDWDKMNNRLKGYYEQLERDDPMIAVSLSASAYTPSLVRLILIITSGTIFRMVALLLLSWLALNPVPILHFLNFPDSIVNSVEAGQPEMIMIVLAPLSVLFLLVGLIVQFIQKRVTRRMEAARQGPTIHTISEEKETERRPRRRQRTPRTGQ